MRKGGDKGDDGGCQKEEDKGGNGSCKGGGIKG